MRGKQWKEADCRVKRVRMSLGKRKCDVRGRRGVEEWEGVWVGKGRGRKGIWEDEVTGQGSERKARGWGRRARRGRGRERRTRVI